MFQLFLFIQCKSMGSKWTSLHFDFHYNDNIFENALAFSFLINKEMRTGLEVNEGQ